MAFVITAVVELISNVSPVELIEWGCEVLLVQKDKFTVPPSLVC